MSELTKRKITVSTVLVLALIVIGITVLVGCNNSPPTHTGGLVELDNVYEDGFVGQFPTDTYRTLDTYTTFVDGAITIETQDLSGLWELRAEFSEILAFDDVFSIYGETIVISKTKLEYLTRSHEIFGTVNAYEVARAQLARDAVLYAEAISLGYSISDEVIQALIDAEIHAARRTVNFDETIFENANLTVEEYFQNRFAQRRRDIIINEFMANRIENFPRTLAIIMGIDFLDQEKFPIMMEPPEINLVDMETFMKNLNDLKEKYEIVFR